MKLNWLELIVFLLLAGWLTGCGGTLYRQLPPPPPDDERRVVALDPQRDEALAAERYVEARRTVLALYEAVSMERWDDAYAMLSNETRLLLDRGAGGLGEGALRDGVLTIDGATYRFDPVAIFLIAGLTRIEDTVAGEQESETNRRKEVYVFNADGDYRRVVVIREGDQWLVHMPRWRTEDLELVTTP